MMAGARRGLCGGGLQWRCCGHGGRPIRTRRQQVSPAAVCLHQARVRRLPSWLIQVRVSAGWGARCSDLVALPAAHGGGPEVLACRGSWRRAAGVPLSAPTSSRASRSYRPHHRGRMCRYRPTKGGAGPTTGGGANVRRQHAGSSR